MLIELLNGKYCDIIKKNWGFLYEFKVFKNFGRFRYYNLYN